MRLQLGLAGVVEELLSVGAHSKLKIDRVVSQIRQILSFKGMFFLLLIEANGIFDVVKTALEINNADIEENDELLKYEVVMKRECLGERQVVIRFFMADSR
jgi:hypothetical protein